MQSDRKRKSTGPKVCGAQMRLRKIQRRRLGEHIRQMIEAENELEKLRKEEQEKQKKAQEDERRKKEVNQRKQKEEENVKKFREFFSKEILEMRRRLYINETW